MKELILNILWIEGYNWYYLAFILICYGILFLALFLAERKRSTVVFSWMVLSSAMYMAAMFAEDVFIERGNVPLLALSARLTAVGPLLLSMFGLWYAYLVSYGEDIRFSAVKKIFLFGIPLTLTALSPTKFHIEDVWIEDGLEIWEPGILYYVFLIYGVVYMLIWFPSVIIHKLKRTPDAIEKKYLKTLLIGFAGYAIGVLTSAVALPVLFDIDGTAAAPFTSLPLLIAILYSILRNNLFNVKLVSAEIFSVVISIVMFINLYNARGAAEIVIALIILVATLVFSVFFIRSVIQEVRSRERIQILADSLSDTNKELTKWNTELERRVAEQTVDVRRAYEVEKKARHELERLDRAKTQFILNTQHHLRTPLTIVKGGTSMLAEKKEDTELSDSDRLYAKKAMEAAGRLDQLLGDFLAITSIKADEGALKKEYRIGPLIEQGLAKYAGLIKQKELAVPVSVSPMAQEAVLHGEPKEIGNALMNLLENAVQYTPAKGNVSLTSDVADKDGKKMLSITVADSGIGMNEEELEKAFDPFERSKRAEEIYATGRGIGLVLARSIVEAYGGTLTVSSPGEGKGTRAEIFLPLVA